VGRMFTRQYLPVLYGVLAVFFLAINPRGLGFIPGAGCILFSELVFLAALSSYVRPRTLDCAGVITPVVWLCLAYAVSIALIGLVYAIGLSLPVPGLVINVEGWLASKAFHQTIYFEVLYLFFPFMLLGQYVLLCKVNLVWVARWFVAIGVVNAGVLFYQVFVDHSLLKSHVGYQQYSGLASDPNAFALLSFWMCSLLLMGWVLEKIKLMRLLYTLFLLVLILSVWYAGSRTAISGVMIFLVFLPVVMAIAHYDWKKKYRNLCAWAPVLLLLLLFLCMPVLHDLLLESNWTGVRLAQSWDKLSAHGLVGLFTQGEARGGLFHVAWLLIMGAAWSGWGPGGFYREYSNIMYDQTGQIHKAFDSPLNHYLMIGCDFGIPVLILNLVMLLFPLFVGVQFLRKVKSVNERFVVATLLVSNVIFLLMINAVPPSYFLEVVWAWTAQLAILLVLGVRHQVFNLYLSARVVKGLLFAFLLLLLVVLYHAGEIATGFGQRVYHP